MKVFKFAALFIVVVMLFSACTPAAPAAAPTTAPAEPTAAAGQPTSAPAEATSPAAETTQPAETAQKPVVVANAFDINTLDPHKVSGMWNRSVIYWIYDCLVMTDREGKPTPELATEWKRVDDLTWEFKLVENAKFHNGEPVNAEAVKFSFDRMGTDENKPWNTLHLRGYLKEVKVIDDYTLQLITEKPSESMLWHLGQAFIVPPKYFSENDDATLAKNPVGSGPYKFVEWEKDNRVVVTANTDYFQGPPQIKDIIARVIPESSSRLNELKVGNVDMLPSIPGDLAKQANSDNSRLVQFESLRKMFLAYQMGPAGPEALKNVEVRKALNYAIDRQSLIDAYLLGGSSSLRGVVNPPNTSPNIVAYTYDPEKAKQMLADAGYPNGFDLTIQTQATAYGSDKEINQVIKQNLEAVGLKVTLEIIEPARFNELHTNKSYPGLMYFGLGTYNNPEIELNTFTCGYIDNSFNYCNEEFGKILDELTVTSDPAKRLELSHKAEEIVWNDTPWLYLWRLTYFQGQSNRFHYDPYLDNYVDLWQATVDN